MALWPSSEFCRPLRRQLAEVEVRHTGPLGDSRQIYHLIGSRPYESGLARLLGVSFTQVLKLRPRPPSSPASVWAYSARGWRRRPSDQTCGGIVPPPPRTFTPVLISRCEVTITMGNTISMIKVGDPIAECVREGPYAFDARKAELRDTHAPVQADHHQDRAHRHYQARLREIPQPRRRIPVERGAPCLLSTTRSSWAGGPPG